MSCHQFCQTENRKVIYSSYKIEVDFFLSFVSYTTGGGWQLHAVGVWCVCGACLPCVRGLLCVFEWHTMCFGGSMLCVLGAEWWVCGGSKGESILCKFPWCSFAVCLLCVFLCFFWSARFASCQGTWHAVCGHMGFFQAWNYMCACYACVHAMHVCKLVNFFQCTAVNPSCLNLIC